MHSTGALLAVSKIDICVCFSVQGNNQAYVGLYLESKRPIS